MKCLGSFSDPRAVQGAADYLRTRGIHCQLHSEDGRVVTVWVKEQDYALAEPYWREFISDPYSNKYGQASWQVGSTQNPLKYEGTQLNLFSRFIRLNWLLQSVAIVSVLIFVSFFIYDATSIFNALKFNSDKPLTWITPAFVHFGIIHLLFNLSWWLYLGNQIVLRTHFYTLAGLFISSALISNWAQFLFVDADFGGLSGVVYAQLGFCWVYSALNTDEDPILSKPIIGFMLIWMVLGFADVLFISMANWAHLFGLLSGVCVALIYTKLSDRDTL
ncbi:rhomboid family intramembrane serine protease GlpG [Pseudoalteromonas luteoviolacea]|uniref:Rhomboid family intramembrane serine protease GlpG n=1 Tax=Pseudoalteromonas luteoviolacea TaxID=43657 RepID=A0A1C0TPE9_9GAMM|nr:rhomboid family intramembrane serine protease GlpG [Pseudoalteromonas luteoviolacea]OCQ20598.1 rhomboid family intramembrane serine protease GlpG [Pseudoalteromonas luteoviolacea]